MILEKEVAAGELTSDRVSHLGMHLRQHRTALVLLTIGMGLSWLASLTLLVLMLLRLPR